MVFAPDLLSDDAFSDWNCTYFFNAFDTPGLYWIYVEILDGDGELNSIALEYVYLINWQPERNGTSFVVTNGTSPTNKVFRVNETLEVFSSVWDVDGNQTHVEDVILCFYKDPEQ